LRLDTSRYRARVDDAQGFSQRRVIKRGAWAGEVGQTQFIPSSYLKFAVDFDGSGPPRSRS